MAMWLRAVEAGLEMKRQSGMGWADVLRTARSMTAHGEMPLAQAMMAAAAPMMIQRAVVSGDANNGLMATGMVAGRLADLPDCQQLIDSIMAEAEARLTALAALKA
jgi:NAD(P)H-dependent flavin oxidoreductase YrpB (nitropropane dioxygenase family)